MTELSRDARSLLTRARAHEGPSVSDRARIRARLEPAWKSASAVPTSAQTSSGLWKAATIAKVSVLLAIASWSPAPPSAAPAEEVPVREQPARAARDQASPESAAQDPIASHSELSPPSAAGRVRSSGHPGTLRARARSGNTRIEPREPDLQPRSGPPRDASDANSAPTPAAAVRPNTNSRVIAATQDAAAPRQRTEQFKPQALDDELAWIGAAQEALQQHKPSLALRLAEQHGFRFPQGALTQERLVVHTLALCALERWNTARRMLAVLEARAPDAPIVARVRSNCGF